MSEAQQLAFTNVLEHSRRQTLRAMHAYIEENRNFYRAAAAEISPDLDSAEQVWDRLAFAILTANTDTANAAAALKKCRVAADLEKWEDLKLTAVTPERVNYVRALPRWYAPGWPLAALLRKSGEAWHDYRLRIRASVRGLAITKASYAACLLYPLTADVACLDVWMQRLILDVGGVAFASLTDKNYVALEQHVRMVGAAHGISTALAQWAMWDFVRTGKPTSQRFFE